MKTTGVVLLLIAVTACTSSAPDTECPTEGEPFETAMLYIEHNATDSDTGVHGNFGGEAWTAFCIHNPAGDLVLKVEPQGAIRDLGVADLFFESREPPNTEVSIDELLAMFPEGEYRVGGVAFDGVARIGTALFTHDIPAEPVIVAPALAEEEEGASDAVVERNSLVVEWEPVEATIDDGPVAITGYQVIITKVDHEDPHGFSRPIYDVHLGPDSTSLTVAPEFLEAGAIYELELLAIEESGNQTISLGFFEAGA
jgi:hypothetical protein